MGLPRLSALKFWALIALAFCLLLPHLSGTVIGLFLERLEISPMRFNITFTMDERGGKESNLFQVLQVLQNVQFIQGIASALINTLANITEAPLEKRTVNSQRPVKTDRRINPKWAAAKSRFDAADKAYQEAGGDAEYSNLPRNTSIPDHAFYNACSHADALSCAVGTLLGAAIVSGVDHYQKEKWKKIHKRYAERQEAKQALDGTKKEFVTHSYGPYEFTRSNYHVRKGSRVVTFVADIQSNRYSVLEFSNSDDKPVTVLEGFSDLDKDREAHSVNAMTEAEYTRYRTAALDIPLSRIIATFEHKITAHGDFKNLDELAELTRQKLTALMATH